MPKKGFSKEDGSQKLPKESISLTAVFIFLGFIFVLLISMLIYLRFCSWSPFYDFYNKKTVPTTSLVDLFNKTKSTSLKTVELKISEADLSATAGVNRSDFPLKNAVLKIKPEGIIVSGKTSSAFWGIPVDITLVPVTGNGKLLIQIKEIRASGVVAPPKISQQLTPKVNTIFSQTISGFDNLNIKEARTSVGFMILETGA